MNKLLIICGPTATGKTDLGVRMARKYNGEIVSADSRQVYRGLDIISGKDLPQNSKFKIQNSKLNIDSNLFEVGYRLKDDVPVWLVDIVEPDYPFNVGEYSELAKKVIEDIWSRKKLPIVVGGSGLYIKSIIDPIENIIIPPNIKLRKRLEGKPVELLQEELKIADIYRWEQMNQSDRYNPRRLIRAIEIANWSRVSSDSTIPYKLKIDSLLYIGLKAAKRIIFERIDQRVEKRIKEGVLEEVKNLSGKNFTPFLHSLSATGYVNLANYLKGKESYTEAVRGWKFKEKKYVRSQIMWFKKEKRIIWFDISDENHLVQIEEKAGKWYTPDDSH